MNTPPSQAEKKKEKVFVVTELEAVKNRAPLNEVTAFLFYGVPHDWKYCYQDPSTGNYIFVL